MTDEKLESLLRSIYDGHSGHAPTIMLSDSVGRGRIRDLTIDPIDRDMFFVFEASRCVGLIYVAEGINQDIHALTLPEYRKRGLMRSALMNVVFPELAREGYREFHVSITSEPGASLLRSIGEDTGTVGASLFIDLSRYSKVGRRHSGGSMQKKRKRRFE